MTRKMNSILWPSLLMLLVSGCSDINFQDMNVKSEPTKFSPPISTSPEVPTYKMGSCSPGQPLSSCLTCDVAVPPPPPPPPLTKAEKLAQILSQGCAIHNTSDPAGAKIPSLDQLRQTLGACTDAVYPESALSGSSATTIARLLDPSETSFHNFIFKGLYYHPPYTDHFEAYFGLDIGEARKAICFGSESLTGDLITTEYGQECYYSSISWSCNAGVIARWQAVNNIRNQLKNCLNGQAPSPTPAPVTPSPACDLRSYEGTMDDGGLVFLRELLSAGYKVSLETGNSCNQLSSDFGANEIGGPLKIVGYKCP